MIELIATVNSTTQAKALLAAGIDILYIGEEKYGLRLPHCFTHQEIEEMTKLAHDQQKKVCVAVNAIMHNDKVQTVVPYLQFLERIGVDSITVGDPGVIQLMKKNEIQISYVYDAHTLVTSAKQINFWAKRGAVGAVLARELTKIELEEIASQISVPAEVLVYGPTCIHQSKRPLLTNYFSFVDRSESTEKDRGLFISEPKNKDTHYSIYEDSHGTHVFADNDINLLLELESLAKAGLTHWKLDGLFVGEEDFVSIAKLFVEVKNAIEVGQCTEEFLEKCNEQLMTFHPKERGLDQGFYVKDPSEIQ